MDPNVMDIFLDSIRWKQNLSTQSNKTSDEATPAHSKVSMSCTFRFLLNMEEGDPRWLLASLSIEFRMSRTASVICFSSLP